MHIRELIEQKSKDELSKFVIICLMKHRKTYRSTWVSILKGSIFGRNKFSISHNSSSDYCRNGIRRKYALNAQKNAYKLGGDLSW